MESHMLNTYHQARYRSIGHKVLRSQSGSSDSSGAPEYQRDAYWRNGQDWSRNQTVNMTRSQDTSSDEDETIEVQEVAFDGAGELHMSEDNPEDGLIEGDDYDVIQVYAVDPNLDLEASSDEEQDDFAIKDSVVEPEYLTEPKHNETDVLFTLDAPVVTNVDEYFIKEDKEVDILAVKDEPVVKDVDEYFIKHVKPKETTDDFVILSEAVVVDEPKMVNVDEFFVQNTVKEVEQNVKEQLKPIAQTDIEAIPKIEELKRYLLEDMPYSKFKAQRSCSLPQSPMHNICLDIDDAKTCLSFEDLNLDLSELTFDSDKDKSGVSLKSDDLPRTLTDEDVNSFLITPLAKEPIPHDDLSHQDMEMEHPVESVVKIEIPEPKVIPAKVITPVKSNVLDFCIEKKVTVKKEPKEIKQEPEDFVDVESCNDVVIPVLAANNLNSLLEQFEATEKLNKCKKPVVKTDEKVKSALTNGMRLQDAAVQLNKNKMRQILMPSSVNASVKRSPSPLHSDHDYCSSKKRYSLPNIKKGQSLLKPEVLSSNSRILNSRHRSCKDKKVIYNLGSDDEEKSDKNKKTVNEVNNSVSDIKKKAGVKQNAKLITNPTRKKLSPVPSDLATIKSNSSVINNDASKASDTPCSQNSNGSIKLTIKNKSEVILNCDQKDSQKKTIEKCKNSSSNKDKLEVKDNAKNKTVKPKDVDREKKNICSVDNSGKEKESRPKGEHFYTALFTNKQDVQIPQTMQFKSEKRSFEEELSIATRLSKVEIEPPQKKKKLNLQEYKLRRGVSSNNSSAAVSPEAIFPDMPSPLPADKVKITATPTPPNGTVTEQSILAAPKKIFDPIRDASRKILLNTKKQKAEAMRRRDEDIVMSKIPKVDNLQLQPLISEEDMKKIVGMAPTEVVPSAIEKPQAPAEYEEIIMVSVGTNTDDDIFTYLQRAERAKKSQSPIDPKNTINFKIKKTDHVLKQNVFDAMKKDRMSPVQEKKPDMKIDKERFKDITATLKSVRKQVDRKIVGNSLFASIQDVVMKKAPEENNMVVSKYDEKQMKSPKRSISKIKTTIVRDFDSKAEHGEDKVILYLGKDRRKPIVASFSAQTDSNTEKTQPNSVEAKEDSLNRKRKDSDMSMSSETSDNAIQKSRTEKCNVTRSRSKDKRSHSKDRHEKHRRTRSRSRTRRRRRSYTRSRSRSRSRTRYQRFRRSDSPYRRKRRSRSPYRRRSPSPRKDYYSKRSRSRCIERTRSKSPVKRSPQRSPDRKMAKSITPPLRKPTISESSDSSTSSSSSSNSEDSKTSRDSCSPYRRPDYRNTGYRRSFSSEDRENNTPVEERRIVFVGKLEKDITKGSLRSQFSKFGSVIEVRLHSKEDGTRYGFVTFHRARDAWAAVGAAASFPRYDVGFGGRRAFCRQSYADLDGIEAKFTESAYHGQHPPPAARRNEDMSFEQMLLEMKKKLNQRKGDKRDDKP